MTTPARSEHRLSLRVEHHDKAQALLPIAITGLVIAFGLAVAGDITGALAWNPLSPILLTGAVAVVLRFAVGAATGRCVNVRIATDRRLLLAAFGVLVVLLEVRQQANAAMLMRAGY